MGKVLDLGPVHLYRRSWLLHMLEGPTQALTGLHPVSRSETADSCPSCVTALYCMRGARGKALESHLGMSST